MNTCIHTYIHTYTYLPTYLTYKHTYTYAYVFVLRRPTCSAPLQLSGDPNGSFVEGSLSLAVLPTDSGARYGEKQTKSQPRCYRSQVGACVSCVRFPCCAPIHLTCKHRERERLVYTGKAIRAKSHHKAKQEGEPVIGVVSWQALLDRLVSSRTN